MLKIIGILLNIVLTSFFFFPFEFTFLPGVNTKMAMAAVGLVLFVIQLAKGKESALDKDFLLLSFIAVLVSICAFATAVINNTNDYTYASYIVSMWVWLGGAYTAVSGIRLAHGKASVILVCNYLISVCVAQCAIALMIDSIPAFKTFVNQVVNGLGFVEMELLNGTGRLYGIGCSLDVAGTRFAAVLTIIACLSIRIEDSQYRKYLWLYIIAFTIITIIGNMIARTTILGVVIGLAIWLFELVITVHHGRISALWINITAIATIAVVVSILLYNTSPIFKNNLRFGFEGFFSLAEKGHWETNSNNILKDMIVFPDTLHTWIIGDGYLENPFNSDPNYVGQDFHGFYMQTDIGYLRFIFYFGLLGLFTFIAYIVSAASSLMKRFERYSWLFFCVLIINLVVWFKVSTDIFLVFAIFLCVHKDENDEYEASIALPEPPENETNLSH